MSLPPHRLRVLARLSALSSFTAHAISQALVLSSPATASSSKSFNTNPSFVAGFFVVSTLINAQWLRQVFMTRDDVDDTLLASCKSEEGLNEKGQLCQGVGYTPTESARSRCLLPYVLGNIFLGWSSLASLQGYVLWSHLFLLLNILSQFYAVFILVQDDLESVINPSNFLTHLVVKTNVGFGVLLLWKSWSILHRMENPAVGELVNIGIIFLLMTIATGPDPTLGLCLLFNIAALIYGDTANPVWQFAFKSISVVIATCLVVELALSMKHSFPWLEGFVISGSSINHITSSTVSLNTMSGRWERIAAEENSKEGAIATLPKMSKSGSYPFLGTSIAPH